jgi:8-oxo-dGTP pyrophosphatase MutT (NUDIX family)
MKFNNRANLVHKVNGKLVWESRSVAVNLVVIMLPIYTMKPHVLVARRGPKAADFRGSYNLIAGYLDWDETGTQAATRETWEEVGIDLQDFFRNKDYLITKNDLSHPWFVKTDPSSNRQNVSLRYGLRIITKNKSFPEFDLSNNEVVGEVEDPQWMPVEEISNYEWAFDHDQVIEDYLNLTNI